MSKPTILFVIGPPAVGKMAVGHEIAQRTGLRLFHNHLTIELVLRFFEFGTPAFHRLVDGFRQQIIDEVAAGDGAGLIFTYVCAFDEPADLAVLSTYAQAFTSRGGRAVHLELAASQAERIRRNTTEFRLAEKPSKRDTDWSHRHVLELDEQYRFNSIGEFDHRADWLRIDNTQLAPGEVAERAIVHFGL
jgi:hypothetical protein